jgi:hypothetical protein
LVEGLAQPFDELRRLEPGQGLLAFLRRERDDAGGLFLRFEQLHLGLLHREQQPTKIALQQLGRQASFLGSAFDEAAALAVAREVHLVEVKVFAVPKSQRDFERVGAQCFLQTADAILAAVQLQKPRVAAADEVCTQCAWRRG